MLRNEIQVIECLSPSKRGGSSGNGWLGNYRSARPAVEGVDVNRTAAVHGDTDAETNQMSTCMPHACNGCVPQETSQVKITGSR